MCQEKQELEARHATAMDEQAASARDEASSAESRHADEVESVRADGAKATEEAVAAATFSRSASGMKISGALEPSSIVTFFKPATERGSPL